MLTKTEPDNSFQHKHLNQPISAEWALSSLLLFSSAVLFWKLGQNTLYDWDEAEYGQIAREMIASGDWLTPSFNYEPKFHQPPLYVWVMALFFNLFGESEFSARLASVLPGLGIVVLTYLSAKKLYDWSVALLSGLILASSYGFIDNARFATTDVMLCFFIYLAFYAYLRIDEAHQQWWYLVWVSFALALLTKSAGGLLAPIVLGPVVILTGRLWKTLRTPSFWLGALLALCIAVPWPVFMYLAHGQAYVNEFFGYHVLARTTATLENNPSHISYYYEEMKYRFFPWLYLIPLAVGISAWENIQGQRRSLLPLLAAVLVLGLFHVVQTKLYWYIIPAYPALSILVAAVLVQASRSSNLLALFCLILAVYTAVIKYLEHPFSTSIVLYGMVVVGYGASLFWRRTLFVPVTVLISGLLLMVSLINSNSLYDPQEFEEAYLAKLASRREPTDREYLILYANIDYPAPVYYSNRLVKLPKNLDGLIELTQDKQTKKIIILKEDIKQLAELHDIKILAETERLIYAAIKYKKV